MADIPTFQSTLLSLNSPPSRPTARRWDDRLSPESRSRKASTLKQNAASLKPDTISLGVARPRWEHYPWESVIFNGVEVIDGTVGGVQMRSIKEAKGLDLATALNYGTAVGAPPLLDFFTEHVRMLHDPPYADWQCCLTSGTTSALEMVFRMFCQRGDVILTEKYTYTGAIEAATPLGIQTQGIEMDEEGPVPESLNSILSTWDSAYAPKPFLLYTIPCGQNPTGVTQSISRRKAIYDLAEQHDLYIIEDDPYYFIRLELSDMKVGLDSDSFDKRSSFLSQLPPSYLSLDRSGRVLRLDSTAKILAPGLRCGWMSACSQIVEKFLAHTEFSTAAPSGISQLMIYKLLGECWDQQGFIDWLIHLSEEYQMRRDTLVKACESHLPRDICWWTVPTAGMFLWIRIGCSKRLAPGSELTLTQYNIDMSKLEDEIFTQAAGNGVLVNKGSWFQVGEHSGAELAFRLTFAAAAAHQLEEGVKRFGAALRATFAG